MNRERKSGKHCSAGGHLLETDVHGAPASGYTFNRGCYISDFFALTVALESSGAQSLRPKSPPVSLKADVRAREKLAFRPATARALFFMPRSQPADRPGKGSHMIMMWSSFGLNIPFSTGSAARP